ncbi:penicillin-binding protein 1A [Thermodesulfobacteriota bacterium]
MKRRSFVSGIFVWLSAGIPILVLCGLAGGILGGGLGTYFHFAADLPKIPDLRAYRPKTVSAFYAEDGTVVGIFYREKRFPVPVGSIPPHVINAFLAAEDARFFSHPGVDWTGVLRALVKNIKARKFAHGGSTITQQVTRNFLLSKEKKLDRKIKEALLAFRLEKVLSKKEILDIYINEIYLGRGAWGVESAARTYFGKNCTRLTVAEAALLAGLVHAPSSYCPITNRKKVLERRSYVLKRMLESRFISEPQFRQASAEVPEFRENLPNPYEKVPYFTEAVRRYIVAKYGEERLYNEGLQVWTTCDLSFQEKAYRALRKGAEDWETRQRRPKGLVRRLKSKELEAFLKMPRTKANKVGDIIEAVIIKNNTPKKKRKRRKKKNDAEDFNQDCTLALAGNAQFRQTLWSKFRYRNRDVFEFRITAIKNGFLTLEHIPTPPIQGALVCLENRTGYVRALVGGLDFQRSRFNRAIQAKRQPGSAFKPIVYSAALEWGHYGPNTVIVDEPIAVVVDPKEEEWIPMNSDRKFLGPVNFSQALIYSRNTSTIKIQMDVGLESSIKMARNLGIESPMGKNLSLCLGASEVSPLELTAAYSVFPNMGTKVSPVLVKKVVDRFGNVLEDNTAEPIKITEASLADKSASALLKRWAQPPPTQQQPRGYYDQYGRYYEEEPDPHQQSPGSPYGQGQPGYQRHRQNDPGTTQGTPASPESLVVEEDLLKINTDDLSALSPKVSAILSMPYGLKPIKVSRRPDPVRVLSPQTSYIMLSLLRRVCTSGTASKAKKLGRRDIGGKTGTTDDCTDAWFIGFNPEYTTGVWMGYDAKVTLGRREQGNKAALPVWMDFMGKTLGNDGNQGYPIPPGIVFWEDRGRQKRKSLAAYLESAPDLEPTLVTKKVCPLDMSFMPVSGYGSPNFGSYPSQQVPGQYGGYQPYGMATEQYSGGSMRVLSPNGETLGRVPYQYDERGSLIVYRDHFSPSYSGEAQAYPNGYGPRPPTAQSRNKPPEESESLWPKAARFFNNLKNSIPSEVPPAWLQ